MIGSVKSNVGHALTAAGAAGLLKVLLALRNQVLAADRRVRPPAPGLDLEASPFRILARPEPWRRRAEGTSSKRAAPQRVRIRRDQRPCLDRGVGSGRLTTSADLPDGGIPTPTPDQHQPEPIAIVGLAAHFGPFEGLRAFQERVLGGSSSIAGEPTGADGWWGAERSAWFVREGYADRSHLVGLPDRRDRLADRPVPDPSQRAGGDAPAAVALAPTGEEAIADAGWDDRTRTPAAGCLVGLGLDLNATNFHVRWSLLDKAREWNDRLGLGLVGRRSGRLGEPASRDAFGPALSANRTMGALGSIVASRVAREFRLGGPSFTVSSEETSGFRALDVAVGMLRRGESWTRRSSGPSTSPATSGPRSPKDTLHPSTTLADGAAVVVLKRLSDAERDGDKVYAVIRGRPGDWRRGLGIVDQRGLAPERMRRRRHTLAPGSATLDVGHAGAGLGAAVLPRWSRQRSACHQQILPPLRLVDSDNESLPRPCFDRLEGRNTGSATGSTGLDGRSSGARASMATWPMS